MSEPLAPLVPKSSPFGGDELKELKNYDVVCGRHKAAFENIGNRRFRVTVSLYLGKYINAPTRKDKTMVIKSIASLVNSNGGRFLQRKKGHWVELTKKQAHEKVGHALRDMVVARSGESTKAIKAKHSKAPILEEPQDLFDSPVYEADDDNHSLAPESSSTDNMVAWLLGESESVLDQYAV